MKDKKTNRIYNWFMIASLGFITVLGFLAARGCSWF
jgi:hypothetical protein